MGIAAYKTKLDIEDKILHINDTILGHMEYFPNKTIYAEFRLLTIAVICDECRSCEYYGGNIYLAVGCPTTIITAQCERISEFFKLRTLTANTIISIATSTLLDTQCIHKDM